MHYVWLALRIAVITILVMRPLRVWGWALSRRLIFSNEWTASLVSIVWGIVVALIFRIGFVKDAWGSHHWAVLIYTSLFGLYCGIINYGLFADGPDKPPLDDVLSTGSMFAYILGSIGFFFVI